MNPTPLRLRAGGLAAALLAAGIAAGCTMLIGPDVTPPSVPAALAVAGPLAPMDVTLYVCDHAQVLLRFDMHGFATSAERERLLGDGSRKADGSLANAGERVNLRVTVTRVERPWFGPERQVVVNTWDAATAGVSSYGESYVGRDVGGNTLPRGRYRFDVTLLAPAPALAQMPASVAVGSSFKLGPDPAKCG